MIARIDIIKFSITVLAASLIAMPSALLASAPAIELSEAGQQWLQAHPSIRLALVSLVIAVILFWNRRLVKEIARRKEVEKLVQDARRRLEQTNKKLAEALSVTNELTALYNRRHFNNLFSQEIARAER
ncbi:MAG: hypothetical protein ACO3DT_01385 [Gammaproteobacteria bacterium]